MYNESEIDSDEAPLHFLDAAIKVMIRRWRGKVLLMNETKRIMRSGKTVP